MWSRGGLGARCGHGLGAARCGWSDVGRRPNLSHSRWPSRTFTHLRRNIPLQPPQSQSQSQLRRHNPSPASTLRSDKTALRLFARRPLSLIPLSRARFLSSQTGRDKMGLSQAEWPASRVRKTFFDFFEQRDHTVGKPSRPVKSAIANRLMLFSHAILTGNDSALRLRRPSQ